MSDDRYVMDEVERLYRRASGVLDAMGGHYKSGRLVPALRAFATLGADPLHPAGIVHSALWHLREEVARLRAEAPGAPAMLAFTEAAREWFAKARDPAFNGKDHDAGHRERWDRMTKAYDAIASVKCDVGASSAGLESRGCADKPPHTTCDLAGASVPLAASDHEPHAPTPASPARETCGKCGSTSRGVLFARCAYPNIADWFHAPAPGHGGKEKA